MTYEDRQWIDEFLREHCTGMDDHGEPECPKCDQMKRQLIEHFDSSIHRTKCPECRGWITASSQHLSCLDEHLTRVD